MLEHGGRLRSASARFGIPLNDWIDLSTGINPHSWTVTMPPELVWSRLPEAEDGLVEAASKYYGSSSLLPVAGSQAAIQALPKLRKPCCVGVLAPGYAEHAHAWQRAGHQVMLLAQDQIEDSLSNLDVLIVINPNNPTGAKFQAPLLLQWHEQLSKKGGWLIADEAFIDTTVELSLISASNIAGLIVLRSLGKFFGLAGIRVGFVFTQTTLLTALEEELGPWTITGPARYIARLALSDFSWQSQMRLQLKRDALRLGNLLSEYNLSPTGGTDLFHWINHTSAPVLFEQFAQRGILSRLFDQPKSLRFGLPHGKPQWLRLEKALAEIAKAKII